MERDSVNGRRRVESDEKGEKRKERWENGRTREVRLIDRLRYQGDYTVNGDKLAV